MNARRQDRLLGPNGSAALSDHSNQVIGVAPRMASERLSTQRDPGQVGPRTLTGEQRIHASCMSFIRRARGARVIEVLCLLVAPLALCVVLRTPPMSIGLYSRWQMIDPNFYTAYAQHGVDLMRLYGDTNYYWVRLGFTLPAATAYALFGPVPGFVALRLVFAWLATIPGYFLFKRLRGIRTAATFVVIVLCSPVFLNAWGTDYPDSAAIAYLSAGIAAIAMPTQSTRARGGWQFAAGALFGLALHSQMTAALLGVAAVIGRLVATSVVERRIRAALTDMVLNLAGLAAITAALALSAQLIYGHLDIFTPSIRQIEQLNSPEGIATWHSPNWGWFARDTYLLVPPTVIVGSLLVRRGSQWTTAELTVTIGATLQLLLFAINQAYGGATLEYYFYSSMLWPGTAFITCLLLAGISDTPALARTKASVLMPVLVVATAVFFSFGKVPRFEVLPVGTLLAAVVALLCVLARRLSDVRVALLLPLPVVVLTTTLTVSQPPKGYVPNQVTYPLVDYGSVLGHDTTRDINIYQIISELPPLVAEADPPDGRVETWYHFPDDDLPPAVVNRAAGMYLWEQNSLSVKMPALSADDADILARVRPQKVVLLSVDGQEFAAAERALAKWGAQRSRTAVLKFGSEQLFVEILSLSQFPVNG